MMQTQPYYYGQGKVFLAKRDDNPLLIWRWLGDVSTLNVSLSFEGKTTKSSVHGQLSVNQRYITELGGEIESTWHSFSLENLSLLMGSTLTTSPSGVIESFDLPSGIKAGDRIALPHQEVWALSITGLSEHIDYHVEPAWGVIEFLLTPGLSILRVSYKHSGSEILPIFNEAQGEYALRYEGRNLAENNEPTLLEFYRLSFDPAVILKLINNESELAGLETKAIILPDMSKSSDATFGRFGRLIYIPITDSTHGKLSPIYTTASTSGEIVTIYPK
ncbi:hypothetical protein [Serratia sp. (in: enterobacteria)]|uniref:phage tail tube protein n=1 Tax=Serratia sp. (in: enterobacteria) TaxID=616 RepID=UPI00398947B8